MSLPYSEFHDDIEGIGVATTSQSFLMFLCFCFICFSFFLSFFFFFLCLFVFRFVLDVTPYVDGPRYMLCKISAEHQEPADDRWPRQWRYLWDVLTKLSHNTAKPPQLMSGLLNWHLIQFTICYFVVVLSLKLKYKPIQVQLRAQSEGPNILYQYFGWHFHRFWIKYSIGIWILSSIQMGLSNKDAFM